MAQWGWPSGPAAFDTEIAAFDTDSAFDTEPSGL